MGSATRRTINWMLACGAAVLLACGDEGRDAPRPALEQPDAPNLLLIVADDLGWNDVGYHGSEIRTPRLDALAAAGVRAERFYVQQVCTPTRAALLTGRWPIRYGLQSDAIRPWDDYGLDLAETTLAEDLRAAGYATALVGKWHLGMTQPDQLPRARGFDHHYGPYGGMIDYYDHSRLGGLDWRRDGEPVREAGHATDLFGAEAVRLVRERDRARPLFLMITFNAPHTPLQAPDEDVAAYAGIADPDRRVYAAMVTQLDRAVGSVLDALEAEGVLEHTLVIFISDNGGSPRDGGRNDPLSGGKGALVEGGVRVPALVAWPERLPAGAVNTVPLHAVDLRPTLRAAAGVDAAPAAPLDGRDVLPALQGMAVPERPLLVNLEAHRAALVHGDWKLLIRGSLARPERIGLFDVVLDPGERYDLAAREPERLAALLAEIASFQPLGVPALSLGSRRPPEFRAPEVWGPR